MNSLYINSVDLFSVRDIFARIDSLTLYPWQLKYYHHHSVLVISMYADFAMLYLKL